MSADFLDDCLAVLSRTPETLNALLRGLPASWTHATEGEGTWSPYVVIGHLIHCEKTDWMPRVHIILEHGPTRPFDPFDREAQLKQPQDRPLGDLLDEFSTLRRESLDALRTLELQPSQLLLMGTHPAFGPVTLRQLLATWTAHDMGHLLQISRVMAKRLKTDVGPWTEYLSVMK
ncbi:DinB family protein [Paludibaculum fermentans]|uniref:DinB family protein n=1 Tax=Paludibaculum fermentans TaxID=1473598 RepID=UPI003EBEDD7F